MKSFKFINILLAFALMIGMIPFAISAERSISLPSVKLVGRGKSYGDDVIITPAQNKFSYIITWAAEDQGNERVQYAPSDKIINGAFPDDAITVQAVRLANLRYTAKIESLTPGIEYSYRVGCKADTWSKVYTLKTWEEDHSFSFLFGADPQVGTHPGINERSWCESMGKMTNWFGDEIEFFMSAGDQINEYNNDIEYQVYKAPDEMRSLPQIVTVGNHDNGSKHSYNFVYENVDKSTLTNAGVYGGDFWLPYDGVLILNLNLNQTSVALHTAFMEKAIAEYTALYGDPLWTFALFHQPFYSAGVRAEYDETEEMRQTLGVELSRLGVDAVFNGHDHTYTRAYMINGTEVLDDASLYTEVNGDPYGSYYNVKDGDVFYITGNSASGSKYYKSYPQYFSVVANQENTPNLTKVDVTKDSLVFTTYRTGSDNEIGDVLDFFAIHRGEEKDNDAPKITAPETLNYIPDQTNSVLEDIRAYDNVDGDITGKIKISGKLDPLASSTLTFTVTDNAGNTTIKSTEFIPYELQTPVEGTKEWKYLDDGTVPFESSDDFTWTTDAYDDSSWKIASGPFGAKNASLDGFDEDERPNTLLNQLFPEDSEDAGANIPTFFFKTTFDLDDPDNTYSLYFDFLYNDAIDVFINGVHVFDYNSELVVDRSNYCGSGAPDDAVARGIIRIIDKELIDSLNLKETGNVLSVQLFQFSVYSEDIYFHMNSFDVGTSPEALPFKDVAKTAWYYESVAHSYTKGLFVGTTDTTFSPNATMTRASVWTVLARISGADISTEPGQKWYEGARKWAMDNKVSDGTNPNNPITREQFALMLYNTKGSPETDYCLGGFADEAKVSSWAVDGMNWAVSEGLLLGRNGTHLAPKDNASRAESCTLLLRYLTK